MVHVTSSWRSVKPLSVNATRFPPMPSDASLRDPAGGGSTLAGLGEQCLRTPMNPFADSNEDQRMTRLCEPVT